METSNSTAIYTYPERLVSAVLWTLICIFGTIGNSMVILAVVFSRKLQTITNAFVVSLSVADLLTSLSLIGSVFALVGKDGWPLPNAEWFCSLSALLLYACVGVSLYSLAAIAINRMVLITRSSVTYAKFYKKQNLLIMICVTWIMPILVVALPPLLNLGALGYDEEDSSCSDVDRHPKGKIFETVIAVFYYPGPLIILLSCYTKTFLHIRKHFMHQRSNINPAHLNTMPQSNTSNLQTKTTDDTKTRVTAVREKQVTGNPGTHQVTGDPGTPATGNPETQVISNPVTSVTTDLGTRVTSKPDTQVTADQGSRATANPEIQMTGDRETQVETRRKELDHQEIHIRDRSLFTPGGGEW